MPGRQNPLYTIETMEVDPASVPSLRLPHPDETGMRPQQGPKEDIADSAPGFNAADLTARLRRYGIADKEPDRAAAAEAVAKTLRARGVEDKLVARVADTIGSRLLKNVKIAERVAEIKAAAASCSGMTGRHLYSNRGAGISFAPR